MEQSNNSFEIIMNNMMLYKILTPGDIDKDNLNRVIEDTLERWQSANKEEFIQKVNIINQQLESMDLQQLALKGVDISDHEKITRLRSIMSLLIVLIFEIIGIHDVSIFNKILKGGVDLINTESTVI